MTTDQRIAIENGIWLCQNCAKLIDSDEDMFPVEKLRHWRTTAEERAREALRASEVAASAGPDPENAGWEAVSFADQRGIRFAMAGHGLAEHDVQACPRLEEAQYVIDEIEQRRFATLAGHSGSGKSIVAYHAASHFSERGWRVLRLSNATAVSTAALDRMARLADRTLLLVDNAQTLPPTTLAALSAAPRDQFAVVIITTINDALPRHTIVIDAKRAVATLARAATARAEEWTPILKELDAWIGEEPFDVPYERRVKDAAKSEAPWVFFFVARGGWQAAKRQMSSLRARDRANLLVVTVAVGQLLYLDGPIPQDWFDRALPSLGRSREWLAHAERVGIEAGALLRNGGLRCPHIAYANNVLRIAFDDLEEVRNTRLIAFLRTVFELNTAPLRGVSWLMRELRLTHAYHFHAKEVVTDEGWLAFRDRALSATSSEDRRDAAYGMETVASWRPERHRALVPSLDAIAAWISASDAASAAAFADIVNSLINTDRKLAEELCRRVPAPALAARFAGAPLADWYVWGKLFGRMAVGACREWKAGLAVELQRLGLPDRVQSCDADTLSDVAEVVHAAAGLDLDLALNMTRAVTPPLARALASSPASAWRDAQGIIWMSLGYPPQFLRRNPPIPEQQAVAKQLVERLDLTALADGIIRSSYRDWEQVAELLFFLSEVSPETTHQLVPLFSIEVLDRKAAGRWAKPTRSLLLMLAGLSAGGSDVPIKSWLEKHTDDLGEVSNIIALLHPRWAADRIEVGVPFNPDALGGLHWSQVASAIAKVRAVSVVAADSMVDACTPKLASALSRMEPIDDDELPEMLTEMTGFHQQRLQAVIATIDVATARERWHRRGPAQGPNHALVEQLLPAIPDLHALRAVAESVLSVAAIPQRENETLRTARQTSSR